MTVDKERVQLLVDALESGVYRQTNAKLCKIIDDEQMFCCLGVACEVAIANGLNILVTDPGNTSRAVAYNGETAYLPEEVRDWYGFEYVDPALYIDFVIHPGEDPTEHESSATKANDKYHKTFAQIAAAFRRTYLQEEPTDGQS